MEKELPEKYKGKVIKVTIPGVTAYAWTRELFNEFLEDNVNSNFAILGGDVIEVVDSKMRYGSAIPIRVLRQTCGHLYSVKADSSILSSLGWSEQFAFNYTWLPRTCYQKNEKPRID